MNRLCPTGADDEIASVISAAAAREAAGWPVDKSYLVFGCDGMEDVLALYLAADFNGEPPYPALDASNLMGMYDPVDADGLRERILSAGGVLVESA